MGLFDWLPIVGDVLDPILGFADTLSTNSTNKDIANMNIEQSQRTNEWNYKMNQETNQSNRDINAATNLANQQIASAYNANQVRLQNDMNYFNQQMWELNNRYNSPSAQLARARDAGINPNIVFGQPVAASPVQQTSIPNQALSQMTPYYNQSFKADSPRSDFKAQTKGLRELGRALHGLGRLPFVKQELDTSKAKTRQEQATASLLEDEVMKRKERRDRYENFGIVRSLNGRWVVTPEEFDSLSDDEKKEFVSPYAYKDKRFENKLLDKVSFDKLSDDQKKFYSPLYDYQKVNYEKVGIHSAEEYEDYKKLHSYGNFQMEIRADQVKNRLEALVAEGKIKDKGVVRAIVHMPEQQYNNLVQLYNRLQRQYDWDTEDRSFDLEMRGLNKQAIERNASHDFFTYIDKLGEGDLSATDIIKMILVGLHDMIAGGSQVAPYLWSKKK